MIRKTHKKEIDFMYSNKHISLPELMRKYAKQYHSEQLSIQAVSNCKTAPRLNKLENELDKLQKVHGKIIKHFNVHSGCDSFKFKDGAVYRVKLERNQTRATLD